MAAHTSASGSDIPQDDGDVRLPLKRISGRASTVPPPRRPAARTSSASVLRPRGEHVRARAVAPYARGRSHRDGGIAVRRFAPIERGMRVRGIRLQDRRADQARFVRPCRSCGWGERLDGGQQKIGRRRGRRGGTWPPSPRPSIRLEVAGADDAVIIRTAERRFLLCTRGKLLEPSRAAASGDIPRRVLPIAWTDRRSPERCDARAGGHCSIPVSPTRQRTGQGRIPAFLVFDAIPCAPWTSFHSRTADRGDPHARRVPSSVPPSGGDEMRKLVSWPRDRCGRSRPPVPGAEPQFSAHRAPASHISAALAEGARSLS